MWGKTEQVKTTGAQLFDASKIPTIEEGEITLKYDGNGLLILNGKGHVNVRYNYSHEATAKLLKPGKLTFLDKNNNNIRFMQACIFVDGEEVHTAYINGNAISLPEEELNNPTTFLQLLCYTIQSDATYNNVIFKPMLYQDGNGEWEPFSGGKPAPAPDNPAPIEVTAHPVTVSIKGGTEQQSITLVPPRPLTKWDKLEKVDGVWRWMYQSRWIESYVDENITGEYISTTGGLNAGAKVCYKSTSEYIPLPQPVQDKLNALTMYAGTTEIANDGGCNMELTYTVDTQSYVDTKIAEIGKAIL